MDILVTKRLTLRPPLDVDAEGITAGLSNLNVSRMLALVPHPYGLADALDYLARLRREPEPCLFTIHRETLIGAVGVHDREAGPTLGFWLAQPWWGKGYATEACQAVLAHAFRHFGCQEVKSYAFAENTASLHVMDKLGFNRIGKGTVFCKARGEELPHVKTVLKRDKFERLFGPLETSQAA